MPASTPAWTLRAEQRVAVLTFERPPHHTVSLAAMTELADHLDELANRTEEFSVVMLTGGDDGFFIAHADLDDLAVYAEGGVPLGDPRAWRRATSQLENMPQPTVAAVNGQAWGGGCEIALACTMRVGSDRAHLGLPEVTIGIMPGAGATQRLPRLVSPAVAGELILSGRIVDAEEAKEIGLLNRVLPTDGFAGHALEYCNTIAGHQRAAVFANKRSIVEGLRGSLEEGLRLESHLFRELNASDEAKAGNAASRLGRSS